MFILFSLAVGFVLGLLSGGSPEALSRLSFRWPWLLVGGLLVQLVLFNERLADVVGNVGPPIYVASTAAVFVGVLRNVAIPGMPVVALGAASNLAAIVANGGYMPAGVEAMRSLGLSEPEGYSNSVVLDRPALELLTDIFALPAWMPLANVFSVGDVLIAVGAAWVITAAMRRPVAPERSGDPAPDPEASAPA
jgi:hypothetical protein